MTNPQHRLLSQLQQLSSEARHPDTTDLDRMSSLDIVNTIHRADQQITLAIQPCLPQIAAAAEAIATAFSQGGRLVYLGAGTSGRLGILDAVECPPTFSVPAEQVVAIIAGGQQAVFKAVEGAEDNPAQAAADLQAIGFNKKDVLVAIAASGRTPYALGGLAYANALAATTVAVSCNADSPMLRQATIAVCAVVGPEVLTGSTRMKAGSAQKMILNMLSTTAMILNGKIYQNLMVDLHASNQKLIARAIGIVMQATDCDEPTAATALQQTNMQAKPAILHVLTGLPITDCFASLQQQQGFLRKALSAAADKT